MFTRSFAVVLGLICTFRTKVRSSLGDRKGFLPEQYDAWSHGVYTFVLLFVQMNVVPSGIWKLLPRMNETWRSTILNLRSWLISFDYPMMSSNEAQSLKVGLDIQWGEQVFDTLPILQVFLLTKHVCNFYNRYTSTVRDGI